MFFYSHVTLLTRCCLALIRNGFPGKGSTGIELFLKVPTVKRPCDGMSGLVRGNRRKAVFAFKWLFSGRVLLRFPSLAARFYHVFRKCGEKSETSERNPIFANKNRRSWMPKTGVWSVDLGFSSHFRKLLTEVCGKFWNFRAHRSFHAKKPTLL